MKDIAENMKDISSADEIIPFGELYGYDCQIDDLKWLVDLSILPQSQRPNTSAVLQLAQQRFTPLFPLMEHTVCTESIHFNVFNLDHNSLIKWIIEEIGPIITVRTLFLALYLLQKVFTNIYCNLLKEHNKMLGCVVVRLAGFITSECIHNKNFLKITSLDCKMFAQLSTNITVNVLRASEGCLSTRSYCDVKTCIKHLLTLQKNIEMEIYSSVHNFSNSKQKTHIPIEHLFEKANFSCILDTITSIKLLETFWSSKGIPTKNIDVPIILHNRHVLAKVNIKAAKRMFQYLLNEHHDPLIIYVLNTVCSSDWKLNGTNTLIAFSNKMLFFKI